MRTGQPGTFGAGVLPLLSHALDQAWRYRTGHAVTLADYERTGGIEGAVAASAQRAYDVLSPAQQAAARQVFTRLAATSSDGVDTADRATRAELIEGKSAAEVQDVEAVLEAFAAERLLTLAAGTVELSHEVRDSLAAAATPLAGRHPRRPDRRSGCTPPPPSGFAIPATSPTSTAAACCRRRWHRYPIGADPARHPPLSETERDFRTPAATPAGGPPAGGKR